LATQKVIVTLVTCCALGKVGVLFDSQELKRWTIAPIESVLSLRLHYVALALKMKTTRKKRWNSSPLVSRSCLAVLYNESMEHKW